jgi:hypothetical protein
MCYNEDITFGIISTIIFSVLFGIFSPIGSLGFNLPNQNLFSQIGSSTSLSELNPTEALGNVTAPLDNIWKSLAGKLNISGLEDIKGYLGSNISNRASNSLQDKSLGLSDTLDGISVWQALGMVKSVFILVANISIAVLEAALWVLKSILGLIT